MQRDSFLHLKKPSVGFNLKVFIRHNEKYLFKLDFLSPKLYDSLFHLPRVPLVCVIVQKPPSFENVNLIKPLF